VNPGGFTAFFFYVLCGGELFGSPSVLPLNSKQKPQCSDRALRLFSFPGNALLGDTGLISGQLFVSCWCKVFTGKGLDDFAYPATRTAGLLAG
jgi:hypothetical protein